MVAVASTGDGKVEFIAFADHTLAYVRSALGYPAYYPVHPVALEQPVRAVLMDLDGTSVRSERFWIWIIEQTTASLLGDPHFALEENDLPYVSGHSVSEHLEYCIRKYCPGRTVEEARTPTSSIPGAKCGRSSKARGLAEPTRSCPRRG